MNMQKLEIFETYFRNEMSSSERAEFERRLHQEPVFARQYRSFCRLLEDIQDFGQEQQTTHRTIYAKAIHNEDQDLLIYNYLHGQLSDSEREAILQRIEQDKVFAGEVEESRSILELMEQKQGEGPIPELEQARKELEKEGFFDASIGAEAKVRPMKNRQKQWRSILSIAASITILTVLGVGYLLLKGNGPEPANARTAKWMAQRSEGMKWVGQRIQMLENNTAQGYTQDKEQTDKALIESLQWLKEGKWEKAISSLDAYLSKHPEDYYAQFALAQALICDQSTNAEGISIAIDILANEKIKNEIGHDEAIEWSLALAYLRQPGNEAIGKQKLEEIINKGSDYAEAAKQLKKEEHENH